MLPNLPVKPKQVHSLQTRDGQRLDADVYFPDAAGPWPVLLMRQPYGRAIASTVVYAHPTWYAAHGYIVVIQDVRGRGTSTGTFELFAHEVDDSYDSVQWAAQLPDSSGQVGMYGFSYQGMTQLYAAQSQPPALKALAPAMVGYDLYHDWAYENGALRLQAGLGWAIQLAAETARLRGDTAGFNALRAASRNLPLNGAVAADPEVLKQYAPDSFWHHWLAHPQDDDYWQALKPDLTDVDLPMLHVGGWFDPYLTGDIRLFTEIVVRSQYPQHFWIGPWSHIPWSRKVGDIDFGPEAINPIDQLQIQWFDYFLKGAEQNGFNEYSVHLFEMGSNQWRKFQTWPWRTEDKNFRLFGQAPSLGLLNDPGCWVQRYQLKSNGLASIRQDDGLLLSPNLEESSKSTSYRYESKFAFLEEEELNASMLANTSGSEHAFDVLVHDPWRPVPSLGGHAGFPSGSFERSALDSRSDVLTYTTELLSHELAVAGQVLVSLHVESNAPTYDLCAVLSVVHPDHRVFNLTQGYKRIFDNAGHKLVRIPLQPICFRLVAGQALRLSLSAACFPAYTVNPGINSDCLDTVPTIEHQIVTLTVHQDGNTLMTLPIA